MTTTGIALPSRAAPRQADMSWHDEAACRTADAELFYHPDDERGPERAARIRHAKEVCAGCPVLAVCRHHALSNMERYGTWGGLSEGDRAQFWAARQVEVQKVPRPERRTLAPEVRQVIRVLGRRGIDRVTIAILCHVSDATVRRVLRDDVTPQAVAS